MIDHEDGSVGVVVSSRRMETIRSPRIVGETLRTIQERNSVDPKLRAEDSFQVFRTLLPLILCNIVRSSFVVLVETHVSVYDQDTRCLLIIDRLTGADPSDRSFSH